MHDLVLLCSVLSLYSSEGICQSVEDKHVFYVNHHRESLIMSFCLPFKPLKDFVNLFLFCVLYISINLSFKIFFSPMLFCMGMQGLKCLPLARKGKDCHKTSK